MKRLIVLVTIVILFSGGTKIKRTKTSLEPFNPETRLLKSVDSLQSVTKKLEVSSLKLKQSQL